MCIHAVRRDEDVGFDGADTQYIFMLIPPSFSRDPQVGITPTPQAPHVNDLLAPSRRIFAALSAALTLALVSTSGASAQAAQPDIPIAEFAARRDSLAARVDSGVVLAFGGRTLVHDFGAFFNCRDFDISRTSTNRMPRS